MVCYLKMKKALVLGGNGFIGGHLIKNLMDDGYFVCSIDIRQKKFDCFTPSLFIKGDLRDINFTKKIFNIENGYDEVYQLAADMGGATYINCGTHDASVMTNSILINVNVAKCCVEFNIKKLFFSSSACVYSSDVTDTASCEEDSVYPAFPDNEYGWEKLFSERMYKSYYRQYGLNVRIARFHSIVGDYSVYKSDRSKAHSAIAYKIAMVNEGGTIDIIGDGKQTRAFLYVKDCITAVRKLMDSDCTEVLNIGSDVSISINDYIDILKKISGKNFFINYIEGSTGVKYRKCDISKALKCIDWKPYYSIIDSASITYNWIVSYINRPVVLYVSQPNGFIGDKTTSYCGIGIKGKLTSDILTTYQESDKYNFISCFIDSSELLENLIKKENPVIIIYNYHETTMPWVNDSTLRNKHSNIIHIMIHLK